MSTVHAIAAVCVVRAGDNVVPVGVDAVGEDIDIGNLEIVARLAHLSSVVDVDLVEVSGAADVTLEEGAQVGSFRLAIDAGTEDPVTLAYSTIPGDPTAAAPRLTVPFAFAYTPGPTGVTGDYVITAYSPGPL